MSNSSLQTYQAATLFDIRIDEQRFPRLRALDATTAQNQLAAIISSAAIYAGKDIPAQALTATTAAFYGELLRAYPLITLAEVERALHDWVLANEVYTIAVAPMFKAVTAFVESADFQRNLRSVQDAKKKDAQAEFDKTAKFLEEHSEYAAILASNRRAGL